MFGSYNSSRREEVGVVAAFLEVHHDVEQRNLVSSSFGVQSLKVFCQDKFVVFPANRGYRYLPFLSRLVLKLLHNPDLWGINFIYKSRTPDAAALVPSS